MEPAVRQYNDLTIKTSEVMLLETICLEPKKKNWMRKYLTAQK